MNRTTFLAAAGAGIAASTALGRVAMAGTAPTFVLVHGAFADGTCWHKVTPRLEHAGARVISGSMPGHEPGSTREPGTVTFDDYVTTVSGWVKSAGGKVVLVGHSMGGMVITGVTQLHPDLIDRVVYLSAYLPESGQSLLQLSQMDKDSQLGKYLTVDQQHGFGAVSEEGMRNAFFNGCSPADTDDGLKHNHKQPLQPFITPVKHDAAYDTVPRYYIQTLQDRAVSPYLQSLMLGKTPAKRVEKLDAGHASFFSHDAQLAQTLIALASA